MPAQTHHHHATTVYAPPVTFRPPSPASSVGTTYGPDATSYSDSEGQLSDLAFHRKWEEKIGLWDPRPEEERAEKTILVVDEGRGKGGPAEQALFEQILRNLRNEIKRLDEDEMFERAVLKGSQVDLEPKPLTNDIDKLMRSIMGSAMNINGNGSSVAPSSAEIAVDGSGNTAQALTITNGPWNNFGKKPASLDLTGVRQVSGVTPVSSLSSMTTMSTIASSNGMPEGKEPHPFPTSATSMNHVPEFSTSTTTAGSNTSGGTVVGSLKRTRNGRTRK